MPMTYPAPATALNLTVTRYADRQAYRDANSAEPPMFDANRPPKYWSYAVSQGNPPLGYYDGRDRKTFGASLADVYGWPESVNLPGPYRWPKWEPAASGATFAGSVFPKEELSTKEQANVLAKELNILLSIACSVEIDQFHESKWQIEYAAGEPRRKYVVFWTMDGLRAYRTVGTMLAYRHANGVDRPGKWVVPAGADASNAIAWVTEPEDTENGMEPVPVPQRGLLATEEWRRYLNPAGSSEWYVYLKEAPPVVDVPTGDNAAVLAAIDGLRVHLDFKLNELDALLRKGFRL